HHGSDYSSLLPPFLVNFGWLLPNSRCLQQERDVYGLSCCSLTSSLPESLKRFSVTETYARSPFAAAGVGASFGWLAGQPIAMGDLVPANSAAIAHCNNLGTSCAKLQEAGRSSGFAHQVSFAAGRSVRQSASLQFFTSAYPRERWSMIMLRSM